MTPFAREGTPRVCMGACVRVACIIVVRVHACCVFYSSSKDSPSNQPSPCTEIILTEKVGSRTSSFTILERE